MKKRFLINQKGVYYLTTGKLLEYNENDVGNDEEKQKGVEEVKTKFKEIRDAPHTFYEAVEITSSKFGPLNTGQSDLS